MVAPRQLERLFDLRTVRRNIRSGLITKDRYEDWLKSLPDAAENVATVSLEDEEREARRQQPTQRFPVISPTRPLVSAPFDDDEDDDYDDDEDDEDDDVDGSEGDAVEAGDAADAGAAADAGEATDAGEASAAGEAGAASEAGAAGAAGEAGAAEGGDAGGDEAAAAPETPGDES